MALRRLRDTHPEQYRAAAVVRLGAGGDPGRTERRDDRRKAETQSETIARWTWLQLLGWAQNNSLSQQQIESLYSIVEGIRSCRPLMQERARLLQLARG